MKKTLVLTVLMVLAATPAFADHPVTGDYDGKMKCENGLKKAGFKDPLTQNTVYYTQNEIAKTVKTLSWPDSANPMSFDAREDKKIQLQHILKKLNDMNCDTQDNPAQEGSGLQAGTQNSTKNAVTPNSFVAPSQPGQ